MVTTGMLGKAIYGMSIDELADAAAPSEPAPGARQPPRKAPTKAPALTTAEKKAKRKLAKASKKRNRR